MKIFDSHCHLDDPAFLKDFPDVLARMKRSGVEAAIIVGADRKSSERAFKLAQRESFLFASVGIHPHDAKSCSSEDIKSLKKLAASDRVKAWGEIGLDYNRMFSPSEIQEKWFVRQLEAADELGLPVIFHERDSRGRFLHIVESMSRNGRKGVVHCFSGTPDELEAYLGLGLHIGITGILTIQGRGAPLREMVTGIPRDRLLVETDAPYLTPTPERNRYRRNEPAFVRTVLLEGPFLSSPRRRGSSYIRHFWTPAFAGVTVLGLFTRPSKLNRIQPVFRIPCTARRDRSRRCNCRRCTVADCPNPGHLPAHPPHGCRCRQKGPIPLFLPIPQSLPSPMGVQWGLKNRKR